MPDKFKSDNTQEQGRSHYTERDFVFTPIPGEDIFRTIQRWEMELHRQLHVGDVTNDANAKIKALVAPYLKNFVLGDISMVLGTVNSPVDVVIATVNTDGFALAMDSRGHPAGVYATVDGATIKMIGTPTAAGQIDITLTITKDGYVPLAFNVLGEIVEAPPEPEPAPEPEPEPAPPEPTPEPPPDPQT